jgi:NADH:ubiquinone oxidoreductase subunit K
MDLTYFRCVVYFVLRKVHEPCMCSFNCASVFISHAYHAFHSNVQGIYLVSIGWNEGSVGIALSAMGFTALIVQTFAGDGKKRFDRVHNSLFSRVISTL